MKASNFGFLAILVSLSGAPDAVWAEEGWNDPESGEPAAAATQFERYGKALSLAVPAAAAKFKGQLSSVRTMPPRPFKRQTESWVFEFESWELQQELTPAGGIVPCTMNVEIFNRASFQSGRLELEVGDVSEPACRGSAPAKPPCPPGVGCR